ncbi:MAG TPA: ABC transporter permease [Flavobacteriales bacterium]|nr:ABC transporter permease [Flavobacteriales bacterium]
MKKNWWKILSVGLLCYVIIAGFLIDVPALPILHETIRNLFFHVTMWFAMMIIMLSSMISSIRFLSKFRMSADVWAVESANTGMFFGTMGLLTGMLWANYTWGDWWVNDPKLNGAAATMLIYLAYFVLRGSLDDEEKRAKISAIYNIFAFTMLVVFLVILPRMTDSLHPGSGGNPGFSTYDIDDTMRLVFYPAIIGWTLMGVWILQIRVRTRFLQMKIRNNG